MKYNLKRKLFAGISLGTALFVFQACYGTEPDMGYDTLVEGTIVDNESGTPIQGIMVSIKEKEDTSDYTYREQTDENGHFSFYIPKDVDFDVMVNVLRLPGFICYDSYTTSVTPSTERKEDTSVQDSKIDLDTIQISKIDNCDN